MKVNPFEANSTQLLEHFNEAAKKMFLTYTPPITPNDRRKMKELLNEYEPIQIWAGITEFVAMSKITSIEPSLGKWFKVADNSMPSVLKASVDVLMTQFKTNPLKERLGEIRLLVDSWENAWFVKPEETQKVEHVKQEIEEIKKRLL